MPQRLDAFSPDFAAEFAEFLTAKRDTEPPPTAPPPILSPLFRPRAMPLCSPIRSASTASPSALPPSASTHRRWPQPFAATPQVQRDALELAAARIRAFHEAQRPADLSWTDDIGVRLGLRWTPLDSVGVYVPGGTAAYPSSVLMNVIPAKVAGVAAHRHGRADPG